MEANRRGMEKNSINNKSDPFHVDFIEYTLGFWLFSRSFHYSPFQFISLVKKQKIHSERDEISQTDENW
jgi:hypothetical protein